MKSELHSHYWLDIGHTMPHFEYATSKHLAGLSESYGEAAAGNIFVEYSKKVF